MPYIDTEARKALDSGQKKPVNAGELNYLLTRIVDEYLVDRGMRYAHINEVVGVLECAKLELYRRVAAPYETEKMQENGDVYKSID